jgi:NAD(P)-dependent dehydrogenase (short-subunit alcohol dehydrogenase family)
MRDQAARQVVITGARSGIGFATSTAFARAGAKVTIVTRDAESGADAAGRIARASGAKSVPRVVPCDLSVMAEVRALALRLADIGPIDTLVHCAAVERWARAETPEGLELTFATNVMAPFILTRGMEEGLAASGRGCVIAVGSIVHRWASIDWADLQSRAGYDPQKVYYRSKLALMLVQSAFAQRFADRGIAVHTLEPAMTRTDFARDFQGFPGFMSRVWRPFMRDPAIVGAEIVALAGREDLMALTGGYWFKEKPRFRSADATDPVLAERMWRACAAIDAGDRG